MARPESDPPAADWSAHLPPHQRRRILRQAWLRRLRNRLISRPGRIAIAVVAYGAICLLLLLWAGPSVALLGLLPLLLVPPLGYLTYWLVWNEFHR